MASLRTPNPARTEVEADHADRAGRQGAHVTGMQRRRLLGAVMELACDGSVQTLSVAAICQRAGVSRRTFYDLFDEREDCVHAAFENALTTAVEAVIRAAGQQEGWRNRVRMGLAGLLALFDQDPGMGRLLVVEGLGLGAKTREIRRDVLAQAASVVEEGRSEARAARQLPPLTAEGVVGAVLSVLYARMLEQEPWGSVTAAPLADLTGSLMALIVHPYLGSAASQRELETATAVPLPLARRLPTDPFKDLPIRLTYRTACVLSSIAQSPGASNRQVADASGITDAGQISRLLTRLQRTGLIQDTGIGPTRGMARAWSLTDRGEEVLQATGQA